MIGIELVEIESGDGESVFVGDSPRSSLTESSGGVNVRACASGGTIVGPVLCGKSRNHHLIDMHLAQRRGISSPDHRAHLTIHRHRRIRTATKFFDIVPICQTLR
jgi:hypothetical protein